MNNDENKDDNKKSLLEKIVFWLKMNSILLLGVFITFWIFLIFFIRWAY